MDYSVTDSAGRRVAVKAHNWLFAIASGLRALEVDAATLTTLNCAYEPDGSILVNATGDRRWWVKSLAPTLPFASGDSGASLPFESNRPFDAAPPFTPPKPATPVPPVPPVPPVQATPPTPAVPVRPAAPVAVEPPRAPTPPPPPRRSDTPPVPLEPVAMNSATRVSRTEPVAADALSDEDAMATVRKLPGLPPSEPPQAPPPPTSVSARRPLGRPRVVEDDAEIQVVVSSRSERLADDDALFVDDPDDRTPLNVVADLSVPAPTLTMPTSRLVPDEPESLAERLFEASMDFMGAEPAEACQIALELVNEFVYSEASSIAIGTLNDRELTFVAATGPVKDKIIGQALPFGKGLIGLCFDMRATMTFADVYENENHHSAIDEATGFRTVAAMCVPILDEAGLVYGVIQLLNTSDRKFYSDDEEAVEHIARALAGALAF